LLRSNMLKGTVNHGGNLPKEYFKHYIKLVMLSKEMSLEQAKMFTFEHFFHENEEKFGAQTYDNFLTAYSELAS